MKTTIITVYRAGIDERYVGVVAGTVSPEDRNKLVEKLTLWKDGDKADTLSFCEVEMADSARNLEDMSNVFGDREGDYFEASDES